MVQSAYFDEIVVTENQPFVVTMKIGGHKVKVIEFDGKNTLDQMFNDLRKQISAVELELRELKNAQIKFEADVDIGRLRKERELLAQHDGHIKTLIARVERLEHL